MKTEIRRDIKGGFFLNETEIIRIKDAQNEQIKKISGNDAAFKFDVKYRSGVISVHNSISEILSEENDGSKSVTRLGMKAVCSNDEETFISVVFSALYNEGKSENSGISYEVLSNDKDWTFVTSSIIEERLNKIKRTKFISYIISGKWVSVSFPIVMMMVFLYSMTKAANQSDYKLRKLAEIRKSAKNIQEYMYQSDVLTLSSYNELNEMPFLLISVMGIFVIIMIILLFFLKWYPKNVFYWGDAIRLYDRKMTAVKFIGGSIVFTVLIGLFVNYAYDKLF